MPDPRDYVVSPDPSIADIDLDQQEVYFQGERLTEERAERIASVALDDARRRGLIPSGSRDPTAAPTHHGS